MQEGVARRCDLCLKRSGYCLPLPFLRRELPLLRLQLQARPATNNKRQEPQYRAFRCEVRGGRTQRLPRPPLRLE